MCSRPVKLLRSECWERSSLTGLGCRTPSTPQHTADHGSFRRIRTRSRWSPVGRRSCHHAKAEPTPRRSRVPRVIHDFGCSAARRRTSAPRRIRHRGSVPRRAVHPGITTARLGLSSATHRGSVLQPYHGRTAPGLSAPSQAGTSRCCPRLERREVARATDPRSRRPRAVKPMHQGHRGRRSSGDGCPDNLAPPRRDALRRRTHRNRRLLGVAARVLRRSPGSHRSRGTAPFDRANASCSRSGSSP